MSNTAGEFIQFYKIKNADDLREHGHHVTRQHESYFVNGAMKTKFEAEVGFGGGDSQENILYMKTLGLKPMQYGASEIPGLKDPHNHDVYLPGEVRDGADLQGHEVSRMNAHYYKDSSKMTQFEISFGGMGESRETYEYMKEHNLPPMHYHDPQIPTMEHMPKVSGFENLIEYTDDVGAAKTAQHNISRSPASYYVDSAFLSPFEASAYHGESRETYAWIREMKAKGLDPWAPTTSANAQIPGFDGVEAHDEKLLDLIESHDAIPTSPIAREMVEARLAARRQSKAETEPGSPKLEHDEFTSSAKAKRKLSFGENEKSSPKANNTDNLAAKLKGESVQTTNARKALTATQTSLSKADLDEQSPEELYDASAQERMKGFVAVLISIQEKKAKLTDASFYDMAENFLLGRLDILNQSAGGLDKEIAGEIQTLNNAINELDSEARGDSLADPNDPMRHFNFGQEAEKGFFKNFLAETAPSQEIQGLELLVSALLADNAQEHFTKLQTALSMYNGGEISLFADNWEFVDDSENGADADEMRERDLTILEELQAGETAATVQKKLFDDDDAANATSPLFAEDLDDRDLHSGDSASDSDNGSPHYVGRKVLFTFNTDTKDFVWYDGQERVKHYSKHREEAADAQSDTSSDDGVIRFDAPATRIATSVAFAGGDESDNGSQADDEDGAMYQSFGQSKFLSKTLHPALSETASVLNERVEYEFGTPVIVINDEGSNIAHVVSTKHFNPADYDVPARPPALPDRQDSKFLMVPANPSVVPEVVVTGSDNDTFDNVIFV